MFLASAGIQYREVLTRRRLRTPGLNQKLVPHPILHPFPIVRCLHCFTLSTQLLLGTYFSLLPTPSPELLHPPAHPHSHHPSSPHDIYLQNQPSWEPTRTESLIGSKRSYDYGVDDFFTDVKKRRVNPSYDPRESLLVLFFAHQFDYILIRYGRASQ